MFPVRVVWGVVAASCLVFLEYLPPFEVVLLLDLDADHGKASLVEGRTDEGCTFSQLVSSFVAMDLGVSRHPVQGYVRALGSDGSGCFYSPNLAFLPWIIRRRQQPP